MEVVSEKQDICELDPDLSVVAYNDNRGAGCGC